MRSHSEMALNFSAQALFMTKRRQINWIYWLLTRKNRLFFAATLLVVKKVEIFFIPLYLLAK
jgi:hypothetical protein